MSARTSHQAPRRRKRPAPKPEVAQSIVPDNSGSSANPSAPFIEPDRRHAMICDAAYFLSELRDFCPGRELDDWLTAEREVDKMLSPGQGNRVRHMANPARPSFGDRLRAMAQELRSEIRATLLRADAEQYARIAGEVHDAEDDALADLLVDVGMAEITRDVEELRDVEAALRRIAAGTYGVCVNCAEPIAHERLEAFPAAKRCVRCQRLHERSRGVTPPPSL